VGLPRFVVEELAAHLAEPGDPADFVFTAPQGGPLRVTAFRARVWRPATRATGLDGLRIHDLRHTAVALWIAAGANPKEVAARAGHASVSFTLDRYDDPVARRVMDGRRDPAGPGRTTLLIVSKRHPAGFPMRDWEALRFNALRRNAVGSRRQSTHSWPRHAAQPASLPALALWGECCAWTRYRCAETTQSDYGRSWGRSA
jgi:hypothetical protein